MSLKLIKLRKICLDSIFDYSKSLLPIYTDQQFSLNPPSSYENPYTETFPSEIKINPATTRHFFIPEINKEIFLSKRSTFTYLNSLVGVMHNNQESAIEVNDFLDQYNPDSIVLELDENRYQLLQRNYVKYKPEKIMQIMKRNKNSLKCNYILLFKKAIV